MENQNQTDQSSQPTDQEIETIGRHKYGHLKSLKESELTEIAKKQMQDFESKMIKPSLEQLERKKNHVSGVLSENKKEPIKSTPNKLWRLFKDNFTEVTGKDFVLNQTTQKNIQVLIYYFTRNQKFFQCENLSSIAQPSFDKGLLIVGDFGNGKTSTLKTFEKILRYDTQNSFIFYTANQVVTMYENCSGGDAKAEFNKKINFGTRAFDDVKTERMASNFGKVNLFKDIIENRYNNLLITVKGEKKINKTFITINYKEGFEGDLNAALDEIGELYGPRVYDRLFEMFNVIEWKGSSFRK